MRAKMAVSHFLKGHCRCGWPIRPRQGIPAANYYSDGSQQRRYAGASAGEGASSRESIFWPYIVGAWATWKKRTQTQAWHRHFARYHAKQGRGVGGLRQIIEEAKQRTARYVGTLRAGAPKKAPFQPAGRQLVAYLSPVTQKQRSPHPQLQLAFFEAPVSRFGGSPRLLQAHWIEVLQGYLSNEFHRLFKTSDMLSRLSLLSRMSFSLIPLTVMFRWKAIRLVRRYGEEAVANRFYPTRGLVWSLLAAPFALVGLAYLASLEQTPVTGRIRSLFVSDGEKQEIVKGFIGQRADATSDDWLLLLRRMLGDEALGAAPGTLLGGKRLPVSDWRVEFCQEVLQSLEAGLPLLGGHATGSSRAITDLVVPPALPPLDHAQPPPEYRLFLIDRPEPNAFSCGFAPIGHGIGPGCIVVFSGCLDAVMREASLSRTPTAQQREDLAVLLSHELAHLVCSHTLEQHASDIQRPQLRKFFADVLRTVIWPLSFVFGPFLNEAISASLATGLNHSHGLTSSCESRLHEAEADAVSLRILANAGYDPRISVRYWQDRISSPPAAPLPAEDEVEGLQWHSTRGSYLQTHPVDAERLSAIKANLATWKRR